MKDLMCLNKKCEARATCRMYVAMPTKNTVYVLQEDVGNGCELYCDITSDEPVRSVKMVDESITNSTVLNETYNRLAASSKLGYGY